TICSRLVANTRGDPITSPPSTSFCMLGWSAEANTSTGAPCWIWATRVGEPAKLYSVRRGGFTWPAADPMDWNAAVSEAAAKTVTGLGAAGDDDTGPGLPHAAATRPTAATRLANGDLMSLRLGQRGGKAGQLRAVDQPLPSRRADRLEPAAIGQPPDAVDAEPQELGCLANPVARHRQINLAF